MFALDSTLLLLIPPLILAVYAQYKVRKKYRRYSEVYATSGITGAEAARDLLRRNRLHDVAVEESEGTLSDHYDPRERVVRLSSENYRGQHLAGLAIAAHEVGHAIQHAHDYHPLRVRHALLPVANFGSMLSFPLLMGGMLFQTAGLMDIGILFYTGAVLFQLVTLPVEFNASSRAMALLIDGRYIRNDEETAARKVLNAAALTYVAAAASAVIELARLLILRQQMGEE
jgi:uncharacterized protein